MVRLGTIVLTLISFHSFGQWIGSEQIEEASVNSWTPKFTYEYQGVYHFGDSESESDLILIFSLDKIYGQIRSGYWSADGKSWIRSYENIKDITINADEFFSKKSDGQFVMYDNGTERIKGLKITRPWSGIPDPGEYEIGIRKSSLNDLFEGKFPEASLRDLQLDDLVKINKPGLKIMRNEIFARYGLIFKADGEMDKYFRSQAWYQGQHKNVDNFLTELERRNIALIQKAENK